MRNAVPATDLTLYPTLVEPVIPSFSSSIIVGEDLTKDYEVTEEEGYNRFKLTFDGLSDTDYKWLRDHYLAVHGGSDTFDWLNAYIPSYIKNLLGISVSDLTGRWVEDTFESTTLPHAFDVSITFELEVS